MYRLLGEVPVEAADPLGAPPAKDHYLLIRIVADVHPALWPIVVNVEVENYRAAICVHLDLQDAVATLHLEVFGVFLAIVFEPGSAREAQPLLPRPRVRSFVILRTHWCFLPGITAIRPPWPRQRVKVMRLY